MSLLKRHNRYSTIRPVAYFPVSTFAYPKLSHKRPYLLLSIRAQKHPSEATESHHETCFMMIVLQWSYSHDF